MYFKVYCMLFPLGVIARKEPENERLDLTFVKILIVSKTNARLLLCLECFQR
jgi:hypothetical protein